MININIRHPQTLDRQLT